ncbi:cyanophycin synthetase [Chitinimonas sp. BJB300]|uniref:cyanophycin synthetase n=1 Tax=Chitinimonas sp. BJB300 TaxID=1559339 RepID=UPI000C0F4248|nr:cyanophycin synthetase [Chitinimonas sp. BJB300]PHV12262.1 cyanophycin synthetase [Chitinimonas sp. BJB300]TSJ84773.1 cyanophycin synthetase [Chitinimonas sp. BJB300]
MEVSRIRALRGPNLWSRHTVIEAVVSCSEDECAIANIPGFEARLRACFPYIATLQPMGHEDPVSMAHALELAALGLQEHAGCPVTFSRTVQTLETGVFQVVVEYSEEVVGRLAFDLAQALCLAALDDTPFDLADALARLHELDEDERLGPSTGAIVDAALARGIPFRRLTQGSLVQFGWGSKQRRIQAAEIDRTGAIAEAIAQDKELTKTLLHAAGVPVPLGRPVRDAEDAWAAAMEIGLPVVVKPQDGNQGKGVTVNIVTRDHLEIAYRSAREFRDDIMVERYLPGHDFRLLVVGDKLIAAARRDPPQVIGDGVHTVRQLVDQVNTDPRRGEGHATSLTKIRFDDIAMARLAVQGLTADAVPVKGQRVVLRNNANLSTGGSATDVTDNVHPEVAARAVAAAKMVGLDICGVDMVCDSVLQPLEEQGGGIVEVNAAPGLRMHLSPSYGKGRAVGEAIVTELFGHGDDGRIPVVAVTGTNGKTTTVRLITHLIMQSGLRVGMTNTDGVYVNGKRIDSGDCSGPRSARNVLLHPDVDAAVFETARGGALREGLAFDRCQVAVVTNIGMGDHLGLNYITTVEDLAVLKRVIVQNVALNGTAVLNAADPLVVKMAAHSPGEVIFFAADGHNPVMVMQRTQGKKVVFVEGGQIIAAEGNFRYAIPLIGVPITHGGSIGFQVENVMASVAAAWALNLDWKIVAIGLANFANDANNAPGRFNLFNYRGATVIADYGHNPDAMLALVQAVKAIPAKRRSVVISGAGDRRDDDIRQQTQILGAAFEEVLLYQDACQRGRLDGEVIGLLKEGLKNAPCTKYVVEIRGEFLAIDTALARLQPGDLCLILVDQVEEALAYITQQVTAG